MVAMIFGGLLGAIVGFFATGLVVAVIFSVYGGFRQVFGGEKCDEAVFWALLNNAPVIALTVLIGTIAGLVFGVKLSTSTKSEDHRLPVNPMDSSRRTVEAVIPSQERALMTRDVTPNIRAAIPADIAGLARVHVQSWRETYAGIVPQAVLDNLSLESYEAQWRRTLEAGNTVFVAEVADDIVGFVSCGGTRDEGFDGEVYALYLLESQHGRGIGKALFQAALEALRFQGKRRVIVWVLALNPTRTFYRYMGGLQTLDKTVEIGGVTLLEYGFVFKV